MVNILKVVKKLFTNVDQKQASAKEQEHRMVAQDPQSVPQSCKDVCEE